MNRRGFLASLAGAAAIALDPERALWVPGAKLISVPAAPPGVKYAEYFDPVWHKVYARLSYGAEFNGGVSWYLRGGHDLMSRDRRDAMEILRSSIASRRGRTSSANDDSRNLFHPASVGLREP